MLDEGRVPLALATLYVLQACEGMAEVHAHGIVHRDLKPSNLFLARDEAGEPIVKVLDFGIAKGALAIDDPAAHALTQTLVAMGTPLYMSPEQIRSSKNVDARSDVWSLGAIFYELLTGAAPFSGNTVTHITAQVLEANPQPPSTIVPGLPRAIDAVVAKALAKRPEDRYVDVAALAAALEPFAGPMGAGASARCATLLRGALRPDGGAVTQPAIHDDPLGGTTRFTVRLARRRAWLPILAVGVLGLAIGALVWRSRGHTASTSDASASPPTASARATVNPAEGPTSAAAASIPSAVGSTVVLDASLAASSAKAPPATTTARSAVAPSLRPATAPAPPVRAVAPTPPANAEPFDPFGERN
jgi:serine/threonine-protein kinase